ncbi:alpha-galactosidase [Micromonospora humidisoli]|uniref:alpha-galactosidase n=1 Tax=Micromonospora humida TaxID=2809018 RepID=A0ABS2ISK4_9ACTN|nr:MULTISPECIES: alpha-galactosidase [Micromonospora]MBM7077322.1 alpha-galactosidase [Micromonospora humida]GHJ08802.1 alpha-galactosidase [Micromonospora sp. AKA109]
MSSPRTPVPHTAWTALRRDGVAIILAHPATGLPAVLHWGADLGPLAAGDLDALDLATSRQTTPGTLDAAWRLPVVPEEANGWSGRPGLLATRDGRPLYPRWSSQVEHEDSGSVRVTATDADAGLTLRIRVELGAGGLALLQHELINDGAGEVEVAWLEATLPVPKTADHLTAFSGRWTREKSPLTTAMPRGTTTRESRRGRGGHDAPWVTIASVGSPHNRRGEAWAVHLGWSADVRHRTDRVTEHVTLLGVGELLRRGEMRLAPGESYRTPTAYFAWSAAGLDGIADRFHTWTRARPQHPRTPRPLVLNTWEAVYFQHDPARLEQLAHRAAAVGVERFVLDDGWFLGRRDDTAGLGDWLVDPTVWPQGLEPLADLVHSLGMQFGLWFEPEMVNLDSELARAHPDWLLANPASVPSPTGLSFRTQYVLDLARPEAWEHVRAHMSALIGGLGIDFIKWDHNRDLVEAVHDGVPGTHAQTLATYRLIERLRTDHPGLEIESCSSGGARADLGILARTDRVWASDSNDPVERQDIQRWTELLLPPELVGAHVGPSPAHSSGRATTLSYRMATALQGSAGFEWDIVGCTDEEVDAITAFADLYKELRGLLHTGTVVHPDVRDPALRVRGVVAPDRGEALFTVCTVSSFEEALVERLRLDGLDPERRYSVRLRDEIGAAQWGWATPAWVGKTPVVVPGRVLTEVGLQLPALWPAQALVLHLTAV